MVDVVSVIVSISNDFSLNSKGNVLFHCTAFCHLRDVPCEDTFTMGVSAATSGSQLELMYMLHILN